MTPRAPGDPDAAPPSGGSSARWRAVVAAASTGPTPHTSPSCPQSSISVAATRRTHCSYATALAQPERRMAPRLGEPLRVRRLERNVEERRASRESVGSTRAERGRPASASISSTASRSRRRPRWSSTQPAARAFFTQFRSPNGATSHRSPSCSTSETGVDQSFPVVLPGTVRTCVREPASPSRASGRTRAFSPRRQRLLRYGFGTPAIRRSKPTRNAATALAGGLGRHRVAMT